MNSENSKISNLHRLILNPRDKMDIRRGDERAASSDVSIYYTWKNIKTINLKYQEQHGVKNLNYLMNLILHQIFRSQEYIVKKHETLIDESQAQIYVDKIQNGIIFKIKSRY